MTKLRYVSDLYHGCKFIQNVHVYSMVVKLVMKNTQTCTCRVICKPLPYNSANSVVPGNEASVTLNVHGVVVRYMYTQSLSAGSLYTACVNDMRACSKNSPGESQYFPQNVEIRMCICIVHVMP